MSNPNPIAPWPTSPAIQGELTNQLTRGSKQNPSSTIMPSTGSAIQAVPKIPREPVSFSCLSYPSLCSQLYFHPLRYNQVTISYDATKEEKVDALKAKQAEVEQRLRERK